ncbi:MAG: hypothetical protein ACSHXF_04765 [Aquaticitalea sp.]
MKKFIFSLIFLCCVSFGYPQNQGVNCQNGASCHQFVNYVFTEIELDPGLTYEEETDVWFFIFDMCMEDLIPIAHNIC